MNKNLFALFFSLLSLTAVSAAEGDTTRIQSHQETHWDWYGNFFDTVQFPETAEYRKIIMYYTLGCPSQGCSEWDYTTKIEVSDPINDSTMRWVELTRIMTPYAGNKSSGWSHTWAFDVTDFEPLLRGNRMIRAHYSGYQDGFTVTINFDFIEGTPPRNVLEVNTIYDGTFKYGFSNDPIENYLVPTDLDFHPDVYSSKFRLVASGHSFGGNENCAEFCPKWYRLKIDGTNVKQEDVWRDDCGSNVLEAQTGTWPYNRAGWCPGDITTPYETDISSYAFPGQTKTIDVDWESYNYNGGAGFDPQYIIEAVVFQYEAWNFNLDASIDRVISPSLDDEFSHINPISGNPQIQISNTGKEIINSVKFEYYTEAGINRASYLWQGTLLPGEKTVVTLPTSGKWIFVDRTEDIFYADIVKVNGTEDDYDQNNSIQSRFTPPSLFPSDLVFVFQNNNTTDETKYFVIKENGDTVASRLLSAPQTTYSDTISLTPGSYKLRLEDSGCDGLKFFANSDGTGRFWVHRADPNQFFPALHMFEDEFGCDAELSFTVGYVLGEKDVDSHSSFDVYPNPSNDVVNFVVNGFKESGIIEVYTITGQLVKTYSLENLNGVVVSDLAPGNYVAKFQTTTESLTKQFVIL